MTGWMLASFIGAIFITFLAMKILDPLARRWGLVDHPGGRKLHEVATPLTGGLAMMLGIGAALLFLPSVTPKLFPFLLGSALLVGIGLLDDRFDVRWSLRLLVQCAAVLVMIYGAGLCLQSVGGVFGTEPLLLGPLAVPFTVFAVVGVINALNMADGSDGLAGSLALTSLCMFAFLAWSAGNSGVLAHLVPVMGALAAFLWFNMRFPWQTRARAFMGDAGSMLLGFTLAWVAVRVTHSPAYPVSPALAPWLIAPPIIDCLVLIARRLKRGRSPFSADRAHMHHLMQEAGYAPGQIALAISLLTLVCGVLAIIASRAGVADAVLVWGFVALLLSYYWLTSNRQRAISFFQSGLLQRKHSPLPDSSH